MRKVSIVFAIAACAASPLSPAQHHDLPTDMASPVASTAASAGSDRNSTDRGKSGFGQIMSVLTGLLQDAAGREATGASSTASRLLSSDQSAVTITVTPVAGRSTFFVDKPSVDNSSVDKRGRDRSGPDSATPPARIAVTTIDAEAAARGAQVAMQAEGDVPD